MPDLSASLQKQDLGHLRIVAQFWGIELESTDFDSALEEICASLLDLEAVTETIDILSAESRAALTALAESNGKMEWPLFARKYGEIREMGAGKRDREHPYLNPISPAEHLYYRGLVAKAFFESSKGSQQFAYIPDDLLELIREKDLTRPAKDEPLGRPAMPGEKAFEILVNDHVLDDATTYLASLRINLEKQENSPALQKLLVAAGIIKKNAPQTDAVKKFLEASRPDALALLYQAWLASQTFDELRLIPEIACEGEWTNQPQATRVFLMNLINAIPRGKWWSLPSFVKDIKEKFPDFQRPAGDYDSWFIKRRSDGQYLRGFEYWDQVDGALIRNVIQTLHWLGRADLASAEENGGITSFRLSTLSERNEEKAKIIITSSGKITVSRFFSRAVRYQIARFCEWGEDDDRVAAGSRYNSSELLDHQRRIETTNEFIYYVTAQSLKRAAEQGLKTEQLLALLVKYTNSSVPPAMVKALKRWDANGTEARMESLLVLRVSRPEIMEEMRSSKAGKFLGELLSPTAVVVKSGAIQKVTAALAELGLLADVQIHE